MTDGDTDHDPIPPGKIEEQQERMREVVQEFHRKRRERGREKRQDPTAVFWHRLTWEDHPKNTHRIPDLWEALDERLASGTSFYEADNGIFPKRDYSIAEVIG